MRSPDLSLLTIALFTCSLFWPAAPLYAEDGWGQWRGPQRNGQLQTDPSPWHDLSSLKQLSIKWSKEELGPSYSGPLVDARHVYVTATLGKQREVVQALRRDSGEVAWTSTWDGAITVPFFAASNGSWIRATPALSEGRLYVAGMRDVLVCLDADDGTVLWRADLAQKLEAPLPAFGFVSSPLVHDQHVYVQAGAAFVKLDKHSGDIVWTTLRDRGGMNGSAFSSPVMATIEGETQLIVQTRTHLNGVQPDDGKVLWQVAIPAFRGMNILTPTVIGNRVFTSTYGGRSIMLEIRRSQDSWQVEQVWDHKSQGYMSSPVVIDQCLYLHLRNRRVTCLDVATGKEYWTTKPFGKYWSMIAAGDRIIALDQNGELLLIQASPEKFQLLDRRRVADDSWAHVAIAGRELVVRSLTGLTVFQLKESVE